MAIELSIIAIVLVLIYFAFLFCYGDKGNPLPDVEVDAFLAEMKRRAGKQDSKEESLTLQ